MPSTSLPVTYTPEVMAVLYSPKTHRFTPADWARLAVSAGDQAGLSIQAQEELLAVFARAGIDLGSEPTGAAGQPAPSGRKTAGPPR